MLPIEDNVPIPETANAAENGNQPQTPQNEDPLAAPGRRAELAREILADIDAYCIDKYDDGHRGHLGGSLIGHECSRYLWYVFRWVKAEAFTGRQLRLFQRGHLEEARFEEYLRGIGAEVVAFQPDADGNANKGEKQFRISGVMGHFGGSLDGQILLPPKYGVPFGMLSEYKTKGTGPSFNKLKKDGVKLTAPVHYAQMSIYGKQYGYKYALYMSVNKNDDDLHVEIVELDWSLGELIERKAHDVITTQIAPARIAESPAYQQCKYCHFSGICHGDEKTEVNCRSCQHATPVEGAEWYCAVWQGVIPKDYIKQACDRHTPIA